jgi:hypothetical protein
MEILILICLGVFVVLNYLLVKSETAKIREEAKKIEEAADEAAALILATAEKVAADLERKNNGRN